MQAYLDLLRDVRENGTRKEDRTGIGTLSVFGRQLRFDLRQGFPAVTTKKLFWKGVVAELLWFLKGSTNIEWLKEQGVHIWDEWADEDGELGPVYGKQWRNWEYIPRDSDKRRFTATVDQIAQVIRTIKTNPDSRRMLVSAWNVGELHQMALEPCHVMFQFYVTPAYECRMCIEGVIPRAKSPDYADEPCPYCSGTGTMKAKLSLQLYQRSADLFLGVPFNIASYALLTHMVAQVCDLEVGEFIHTFGDAHIYLNHLDQVDEQLSREPRDWPRLWINPDIKDIDGFSLDDFRLDGYNPHPSIKAPVAV